MELLDVVRDLQFLPWYDDELGMNHRGFLKANHQIFDDILVYLPDITKPVYLTGHSKGAAEATLLAARLRMYGYDIAKLVVFGSPRVAFMGSNVDEILEDTEIRRYETEYDLVTSVPFMSMGYHHVGEKIKLEGFKGHSIMNYIAALEERTYARTK